MRLYEQLRSARSPTGARGDSKGEHGHETDVPQFLRPPCSVWQTKRDSHSDGMKSVVEPLLMAISTKVRRLHGVTSRDEVAFVTTASDHVYCNGTPRLF